MAPRLKLLVAVHLALAVVPASVGLVPRSGWGLLVLHAMISVPLGQLMLLSFWLGLGTAKSRHRLFSTTCGVAYGVCWLLVAVLLSPGYRPQPITSVVGDLAILLGIGFTSAFSGVALVSFGVCLLIERGGMKLRRVSDREPAPARLQYSIAHVLLITSVVAALLALARAAQLVQGIEPWEFLARFAVTILFLVVNLAYTTWAVLGAGRIRLSISLVLLFSIFLGITLPLSFRHGELTGGQWILLSEALALVLSTVIVITSLLVVRSCGYRLIRKTTAHR